MRTRLFLAVLVLLSLGLPKMKAQCTASYTYSIGPGGYVHFASTSTGTSSFTRYTWFMGNGVKLTQLYEDTAGYAYCFDGLYTVSLIISDSGGGGCLDSTAQVINITNSPNAKCYPANFTYAVTAGQVACTLNNASPFSTWDYGDGSVTFNSTHNYTHNGTYTVTCYTQYQYGAYPIYIPCDTFTQAVAITNVACVANFWADSNNVNNNLYVYNQAQGDTAIYYSANGGAWTAGVNRPAILDSFLNLPAGNNTICQKIYGHGCTDSICKTVFVNCMISETHTTSCGQVAFTTSANPNITSAAWYIGGNLVSTQLNPVINYTNTASFYISYSLQTSLCTKNDSILVQIGPTPQFWIYPDSISGPHNWLVYVNNQPNYTTYHWDWGDGTSSYSAFPTHTYTVGAWYMICLTITDNCGDSATSCQTDSLYRNSSTMVGVTVTPMNSTDISTHDLSAVNIYPVPASDVLTIEHLNAAGRVEMFDSEGRKVLSEPVSEKRSQINIGSLAPGFYIMKIHAGRDVWQKKIIKQ